MGDLANGDAATLTIEVDIDAIEDLEITATASSDLMAPDASNNTSSVFVTPQLVHNLATISSIRRHTKLIGRLL